VAPLDSDTKQLLTEQWLPRVRELRDQRKPIVRIMICTILVPLVAALAIVLYQILTKDLDVYKTGLCGALLGLAAIAFVYLGRLQNCNDVIVVIEFSVYLGERDQIIKAIGNISCFGKMQDLLRDIRPLLRGKV
jgi:uncharacterized membrane protein